MKPLIVQQTFVKVFSLFATVLFLYSVIIDRDILQVHWAVCLTGGPVAGQPASLSLPHPDCQHKVVAGLETYHGLEADNQEYNLQSTQSGHLIWFPDQFQYLSHDVENAEEFHHTNGVFLY